MAVDKKHDDHIIRPPTLSRGQQIGKFLYNPSTHELLGRTAKSWFQILVFYVILYAFLAGFFAGLLMVFFQTLNLHKPTWTMESSLIGINPGMGFRPRHPNPDESVITYKPTDSKDVELWEETIDTFLKPYFENNNDDYIDNCMNVADLAGEKSCRFDVATLKNCANKPYGFNGDSPCIFLKLNKIIGWKPECYDKVDIEKNEMDMPVDLREKILSMTQTNAYRNVWSSCSAHLDNPNPERNVTVTYSGPFGFPDYYFPYQNQKGYQSPLIAIQLQNMPMDAVVRVSCRLWAKNINVDRQRRLGMTNFEILMVNK